TTEDEEERMGKRISGRGGASEDAGVFGIRPPWWPFWGVGHKTRSRWVFVYEKGYQTSSGLISSVSVKLKGLAVTKLPSLGPQVWDVADYVFPAQGDSSFVVMTNFIATPRQAKGHCAEGHAVGEIFLGPYPGGLGSAALPFPRTRKGARARIIVAAPRERQKGRPKAENFTLFIKNSISFPRFKVTRRNLVEEVDAAYMKTCLYHKTLHPLCPVFKLGYVVQESGQNFSTLAEKGGVVGITIDWHCDLDWHVRHCKPVYEFHGLFARHFVENGTNYRHLFKVFGIRFDILVDGKAGKFDIIPTMTTIGSGIGIFGVPGRHQVAGSSGWTLGETCTMLGSGSNSAAPKGASPRPHSLLARGFMLLPLGPCPSILLPH
ncbi:hypothetical protein E2I00_019197, partial [Balaenoptera physalus]